MSTPLHCLKIKLLRPEAKVPAYAHPGEDAAFDIFSCEEATIMPGKQRNFQAGIASEFPSDYWLKIEAKSGPAMAFGITVIGGVIDAGYRGEWVIMLANLGEMPWTVAKGSAIAQGVLHLRPGFMITVTDRLERSGRGEYGLGSGHQTALPLP
jgi:dUTP pyrophosphatase